MTVSISTDPGSADLLLFGDPEQAAATIGQAIGAQNMLENVRRQAGRADAVFTHALNGRVAEAGASLLQGLNLGTVLLAGWQKYRALREAARRTLDHPGTGEMVRLAEHKIFSKHAPWVDITVNGQPLGRVTFGVDLSFDIACVQASVLAGRLLRLTAGECTAAIAWSIQGFEVARKDCAPVTLPFNLSLGDGIPILPPRSGEGGDLEDRH
ncbi:hypothetical protein [Nonomuraea typhae]|uniref:hypothetical protein n=1 Tax=Nonomuraea typhae TaxID=2603600 RepID=UPI0012F99689|nr:hypothetical protein [Nonomuraea typhae]